MEEKNVSNSAWHAEESNTSNTTKYAELLVFEFSFNYRRYYDTKLQKIAVIQEILVVLVNSDNFSHMEKPLRHYFAWSNRLWSI